MFSLQWKAVENAKIRELGKTPLLLTLICLAFDETLQFTKRRVDLYAEAVDALLKKWDSSRAIIRSGSDKQLEAPRKKQLLSFVAYNTFTRLEYLIPKNTLLEEIRRFTTHLPYWDTQYLVDADGVLRTMESHHGLIVERARDVYSFSHLTIQEYFTAQYISDNVAAGCLDALVDCVIEDIRWSEVMLMCSSLQSNATSLLGKFAQKIQTLPDADAEIIGWLNDIQKDDSHKNSPHVPETADIETLWCAENAFGIAGMLYVMPAKLRPEATYRATRLARKLSYLAKPLNKAQVAFLLRYLRLTMLLIECLHISSVHNREEIEGRILAV